jgi:hypothetical protein
MDNSGLEGMLLGAGHVHHYLAIIAIRVKHCQDLQATKYTHANETKTVNEATV